MFSLPDLSRQPVNHISSQVEKFRYDPISNTNKYVYTSPAEKAQYVSQIYGMIKTCLQANQSIQVDNEYLAKTYGYTYVSNPSALIKPPRRYSDINIKNGIPFEDFERRKRAGEIMVSDYERSVVRVRQDAGLLLGDSYSSSASLSVRALIDAGLLTVFKVNGSFWACFNNVAILLPLTSSIATYFRKVHASAQWVYPPVVTASTVFNQARSFSPEVESLVVGITAKANAKAIDILTAAAEMPETVKSAFQVIRSAAHIISDFKKRKFNVSQAYAVRKKKANARYKARMKRLTAEIVKKKTSDIRRRKLIKERDRITIGHREYLQKTALELATALSDLWLNFRYNIMPNVYLAQDIYDAREQYMRRFTTSKGTSRTSVSIPLYDSVRIQVDVKSSVMIKRRFSREAAQQGASIFGNSLTVTAWELIPLSFVVDWFINIGDLLASRTYNYSWEQQGATLAKEVKFDSEIQIPDEKDYSIEPRTVVSGFYYKRIVINPQDYCGLVWQPSLGLERQIDAIALLWRPVRSLLTQGK